MFDSVDRRGLAWWRLPRLVHCDGAELHFVVLCQTVDLELQLLIPSRCLLVVFKLPLAAVCFYLYYVMCNGGASIVLRWIPLDVTECAVIVSYFWGARLARLV